MKQVSCLLLATCLLAVPINAMAHETYDAQTLVNHVKKCIADADNKRSKLTNEILQIKGMSSAKVRHLLNNLCSLPETCYLEIGVWQGSTFVSALYQNEQTIKSATAIDNWSEYKTAKSMFFKNTAQFLTPNAFTFLEQDSFTVDLTKCEYPINIYFYDGNHSVESQRKAFTYFDPILADAFIAIVDDWVWNQVQEGTRQAFNELEYKILFEAELPTVGGSDTQNWWNGLYVAVIQKP